MLRTTTTLLTVQNHLEYKLKSECPSYHTTYIAKMKSYRGCCSIAFCILAIFSIASHPLLAQDSWETVLRSMEFERSKLVSGRVHAVGLESADNEEVQPVEMRWLIDHGAETVFFLRTQRDSDSSLAKSRTHAVWSFPDRRIFFSDYDGRPLVNIENPDALRSHGQLGSNGFMDLRAIGLVNHYDFYASVTLEQTIQDWKSPKEVHELSPGVLAFKYTVAGGRVRITIHVNTTRGYTIEYLLAENGSTENGLFKKTSETVTSVDREFLEAQEIDMETTYPDNGQELSIKWQLEDGVWVPVNFNVHITELPKRSRSRDKPSPTITARQYELALALTWSDINREVDDEDFALSNFGLPAQTKTFDRRGDTTRYLGEIGGTQKATAKESRIPSE